MTTNHQTDEAGSRGSGALLACAMLIVAMIIVQAGRMAPVNEAWADVSQVAGLSILTASSGDNEDVLCILDTRAEKLLVYSVVNRNSVELQQAVDLGAVFTEARAATGVGAPTGRPRR
ncbi:MAG: hypothetical protein EA379_00535 [Phycisphaerales bacterium]|nr:MAG: hypothetical protein EA379_00535 [Phycisphaerales bacterium]